MKVISDDSLAIVTIWQEARGESYEGKLAVASVIRNRMKKKYSSDGTAAGTVLKDFQFSGWNADPKDSNRELSVKIDDQDGTVRECIRAWNASADKDTVSGAVLYFNPKIVKRPKWAMPDVAELVATVGSHEFYVPKG